MEPRIPIDSRLRQYLDEQPALVASSTPLTNEERARNLRKILTDILRDREPIIGLPNSVKTVDVVIERELPARLYLPAGDQETYPVLVYFHGGGWVAGSVETLDPFCRLLSEEARVIIVSADYRLAPENRYPAALEDAFSAVQWAVDYIAAWSGDPKRICIGGDSAGANLAAVAANRLCASASAQLLKAMLLLYPVTDHPSRNSASRTKYATGYGLDMTALNWFWEQYAPGVSPDDPETSPLRLQNIPKLPPTLVTTAEYDVLRDEGIAYAHKLKEAGVDITHLHAPDMHHNFPATPGTVGRFPQSVAALKEIAAWLRNVFDPGAR